MKKTENLFYLVKSLKKAEKRYFTLYATQQGNSKNYLRLFEAIDAQSEYDEPALIEEFRNESFSNHFSVAKKYLYDSILKSLKLFFADYCISIKIPDTIKEMRVLLNKGMFKQALKQYEKTEEIFRNNEQYGGLLDLLTFGEQLWRASLTNGEAAIKVREIHREKQACVKYLSNLNEYLFIRSEIEYVFWELFPARTTADERKLTSLLKDPLLQSEHQAISISAKMAYYDCLIMVYLGTLDYQNLYKVCNRALELLDPDNQDINHYFTLNWHTKVYHNLVRACIHLGKEEELTIAYTKFESYINTYKDRVNILDSINGQVKFIHVKAYMAYHQKDYAEVVKIADSSRDFLDENWEYLPAEYRGDLALKIGQALLFRENAEEALTWVDRILEEEKTYPLDSQICHARILGLMTQIDLENFFLLESLTRSAYRLIVKKDKLYPLEKSLFKYLNKIAKNHQFDLDTNLDKLTREAKLILNDKFNNRFTTGIDLIDWLEKENIKVGNGKIVRMLQAEAAGESTNCPKQQAANQKTG